LKIFLNNFPVSFNWERRKTFWFYEKWVLPLSREVGYVEYVGFRESVAINPYAGLCRMTLGSLPILFTARTLSD
jgi:hypothetical protein